jgi:hypothetical protein
MPCGSILQSSFGRNIIQRLALATPLLAADLADYLETTDAAAKALTPAALKRLDKETGLVRELWSLARSSVDVDKLVRLSAEPDSAFALLDRLGGLSGGGEVVALMPEPSAELFVFPPGHPAPNVVYARHPLAQRIFYPLAQFHRLTFEHKVFEAVVLLQSLGARHLNVRHIVGMSADMTASVATALRTPMTPPAAAGGPPAPRASGSSRAFGRDLGRASRKPIRKLGLRRCQIIRHQRNTIRSNVRRARA